MKASADSIVHRIQSEYLDRLRPTETGIAAEMRAYAAEHRVPIADPEVARFLEITSRSIAATRALEIGMAIGYGALHLAIGMGDNGLVTTIDPSEEMISLAEDFLARSGIRGRVRIVKGEALRIIPTLSGGFDLVYIDALKDEYSAYLDATLPMLRIGGVYVVDNLLWGGQVAGEIREGRERSSTEALREFNTKFVNHPQLLAEVLSVGDGLGYAVKVR